MYATLQAGCKHLDHRCNKDELFVERGLKDMVENIYGRKTHPQCKYHERFFLQSHSLVLHNRRVSGEPPYLRTIAETEDDLPSESFSSLVPSIQTDSGATSSDRKQRAISLPTIYRDGSYLRINFPVKFNEGAGTRRFSEPAVSWISKFRPAIVSMPKKSINDTAPYFPRTPKTSLDSKVISFEQKIQIEKRRHSDPLIYSSESIQKIGHECLGSEGQKDTQQAKTNDYDSCTKNNSQEPAKPATQISDNVTSAPTRRRKSSLVPIPFSIVKNCSSQRQTAPQKRRLSFPLSKNEEKTTKNLPEIHRYAWKENNTDQYGSSSESVQLPLDLMIHSDSLGDIDLPKQEYEKKHSCEEIITQWMKFFG